MNETSDIEFIERYPDRLFTKWKGGRYRFYLYDKEVEFYAWVFENSLEKEIKFKKIKDMNWRDRQKNPYYMKFKTGETFIAFKLTWL